MFGASAATARVGVGGGSGLSSSHLRGGAQIFLMNRSLLKHLLSEGI